VDLAIAVRDHEVAEVAQLDEDPVDALVLIATRVSPGLTVACRVSIATR
jgi:inorganic pyrophosphatase